MSASTEARIKQLCSEALAVKTEEETHRIIGQLRVALADHLRLAKEELEAQATNITILDAKAA